MRVLNGLQSSGSLHIGNYFGAIKPMLELQDSNDMFMFIANYHALTSLKDSKALKANTIDAAITFLSLGLDPDKSTFWAQSDVKEVLELYWILSAYTPTGLLERATSYKDKVTKGIGANHALFSYPVLMAADILLYDSQVVPVGKDQIQHVEMARDIAIKFNNEHGEIFVIPEHKVDENVATVPGIDGAKMSKSYSNDIKIFMDEKPLQKLCNKVVTDSTPMGEALDWKSCNVYALASLFLNESKRLELQDRYKSTNEGYGHFKKYLKELIWDEFFEAREKRAYYLNNQDKVREILYTGAEKASKIASVKMEIIRDAVGII
ncbi:MAG: tryptophan--tRNA ligase [Sulfurovum sp.]|nr:tryptophan--tRNA ligase [Sulfurovum sp.]